MKFEMKDVDVIHMKSIKTDFNDKSVKPPCYVLSNLETFVRVCVYKDSICIHALC